MAVIADKWPSINVTVVDLDQGKIDAWNSIDISKIPVFEPGLDKLILIKIYILVQQLKSQFQRLNWFLYLLIHQQK